MDYYLDMDCQFAACAAERQRNHERWVERHASQTRFHHDNSRIRARVLVDEAYRQEKAHLAHQYAFLKQLIGNNASIQKLGLQNTNVSKKPVSGAAKNAIRAKLSSSPERCDFVAAPDSCTKHQWPGCACVRAPTYRVLTPKYRAMNLLREHYPAEKLEAAVASIQANYDDDHAMIQDLLARFGSEPEADPHIWLRCVEERQRFVDAKWREIATQVHHDMRDRDAFPLVIRNLSIMRIFLEGSQAASYGCDVTERGRRDSLHQTVLNQLAEQGTLFLAE